MQYVCKAFSNAAVKLPDDPAGSGRDIRHTGDLEMRTVYSYEPQRFPDNRVTNLVHRFHPLQFRIQAIRSTP